jgi:hypothetical protein
LLSSPLLFASLYQSARKNPCEGSLIFFGNDWGSKEDEEKQRDGGEREREIKGGDSGWGWGGEKTL